MKPLDKIENLLKNTLFCLVREEDQAIVGVTDDKTKMKRNA